MLNAGSVVCLHCGRVIKDLYYCNSELDERVWVRLKRTVTGRYFVERYIPDNNNNKIKVTNVKLTNKKKDFKKGLNETIYVDLMYNGEQKNSMVFKRSCPFCLDNKSVNTIFEGLGELPTYVIAVIGTTSVGKSRWLGSLCYVDNQIALNLNNDYYKIKPSEVEATTALNEKTGVNSKGKTTLIKILERRNNNEGNEPIANVLVLDVAGEMFKEGNQEMFENSQAYTLFSGTEDFTGVDAVVFMDAADCNEKDLIVAYNCVNELGLLNNKPVAYVLNKMDLLFENPPKIKLDDSCDYFAPILSSSTFKKAGVSYSQKDIVPRIKLETLIASQYRSLSKLIFSNNPRSAGFVITAGRPVTDPLKKGISQTGELTALEHDYTESINVIDPLIWTLNELGILPIN